MKQAFRGLASDPIGLHELIVGVPCGGVGQILHHAADQLGDLTEADGIVQESGHDDLVGGVEDAGEGAALCDTVAGESKQREDLGIGTAEGLKEVTTSVSRT